MCVNLFLWIYGFVGFLGVDALALGLRAVACAPGVFVCVCVCVCAWFCIGMRVPVAAPVSSR